MAKKLSSNILKKLIEKSGGTEGSIRAQLSYIRRPTPTITLNGAAQVYASKRGFNVLQMLDEDDRASIPNQSHIPSVSMRAITPKTEKNDLRKKPPVVVLNYSTTDPFGKKHIEEANRAYNAGCYTAAVIVCRKIFENLLIDILVKQFPEKNKTNKELYYDTVKKRFKDLSVIDYNLYQKRNEFPSTCLKPIERLHDKLGPFMKDANNHTHSWYHICSKKEFDEMNVQQVADLIATITPKL